jgi:hypothetical protein
LLMSVAWRKKEPLSGYVVAAGFERSAVLFESLVSGLASPQADGRTHDQVERDLEGAGRELLRQLMQDHADLRESREEPAAGVVGCDGVARTRRERGHRRGLVTVFGRIGVGRIAYRAPRACNVHPADGVWNMPSGLHSHGLRRLVAIEATRGSFESAQAAIERATGVRIGKRQVEQIAVDTAVDIEAFYADTRPGPADPSWPLVLTCDGKGVVMRQEALRAATAKAAASTGPRLATRISPGEKPNRKRMAELVGVYDLEPVTRAPADVITTAGADRERPRRPKASGKWLTGSLVDDIATVIAAGFDEAQRRDPDHRRTWVGLVDGNLTQIDALTAEAARRGVTVHLVIDFIHVVEYVWGAAWSFFDKADPAAEEWVGEQLLKILHGKARQVAAGIRRRATTFGYHGSERAGADKCANYLCAKADHLHYDTALANGWPIATGIIEGACRYLVKDRLDITGARWGLPGAEAILKLRALISNDQFNNYWAFHLQQEHNRNHGPDTRQSRDDYTLAG